MNQASGAVSKALDLPIRTLSSKWFWQSSDKGTAV
jgi:hypothetical protein